MPSVLIGCKAPFRKHDIHAASVCLQPLARNNFHSWQHSPAKLTSPAEVQQNHLVRLSGAALPLAEGTMGLILTFQPWPIRRRMNSHVMITAPDFKKRGLIPLCSALELCRRRIRRLTPTIKAEFCDIVHVAVDILIKALRILDALIYSNHLLGDQIPD